MLLTFKQKQQFLAKHPQTCPQCGAQGDWECEYEPDLGFSFHGEGGEAIQPHYPCVVPKCKGCSRVFPPVRYRLPE